MILDELEYEFSRIQGLGSSSTDNLDMSQTAEAEINDLRTRLLPLLAMEASLAAELGGMAGRGGFFVRSGWQSHLPMSELRPTNSPAMANLAGRTLGTAKEFIVELWKHPTFKGLFNARRIFLEESAPLCVAFTPPYTIPLIIPFSFLDNLDRISEPDYIPSIGKHPLRLTPAVY